jgi:hypothetical protein
VLHRQTETHARLWVSLVYAQSGIKECPSNFLKVSVPAHMNLSVIKQVAGILIVIKNIFLSVLVWNSGDKTCSTKNSVQRSIPFRLASQTQ